MNKKIIFGLLLIWLGWHMAQPINLTQADIGRHIKNGEHILNGDRDVLYTNYYTYTCANYSFINHHWLFGILAFWIWLFFDFAGLSLAYIILTLVTFRLFTARSGQSSSFALVCAFSLMSIPLIASRPEIRPEMLSLLFAGLVWYWGDRFQSGALLSNHFKIYLFLIQVFWVNTHIFFTIAPVLLLLFALHAKLNGQVEKAKVFLETYLIVLAACLINPSGLEGALLPFNIMHDIGYSIIEEQSIFFILPRYPSDPVFLYFLVSLVIAWLGWAIVIKREGFKKHAFMILVLFLMSLAAMRVVRCIGPYAFFWVPLTVFAWSKVISTWPIAFKKVSVCLFLGMGILAASLINFNFTHPPMLGLAKGNNESAIFFKQQGLKGPIFNNYDIGGYLIFHLNPPHQLFVDNRVEAFPGMFFRKIYIPMQVNEGVWQAMDNLFHFNVIFFNRTEKTPWTHKFITAKLNDPLWAPVFVDENTIIFLRRNLQNSDIIRRFELRKFKLNTDTVLSRN